VAELAGMVTRLIVFFFSGNPRPKESILNSFLLNRIKSDNFKILIINQVEYLSEFFVGSFISKNF